MVDRSITPDNRWVFHYRRKYIESTFGSLNESIEFEKAEERFWRCDDEMEFVAERLERTLTGEIAIAICNSYIYMYLKLVLMDATTLLLMEAYL